MRKREFISLIAGATAWPLTARAQQSAMPVIGYLSEVPGVARLNAAFQRGMAELGYVEGKNFATEYGSTRSHCLKLPPIWFAVM